MATAVSAVPGVAGVNVELDVMSEEQRAGLRELLQGPGEKEIPFNRPGSTTRVIAVASGKGGVGKSSSLPTWRSHLPPRALRLGCSTPTLWSLIPRILGIDRMPTRGGGHDPSAESAHGVSGDLDVVVQARWCHPGRRLPGTDDAPALKQFLTDVYWGDLDYLLLDLPPAPGTWR